METCLNENLKTKKSFTVNKVVVNNRYFDWEFDAFLDKDKLSELNANNGGKCNYVETDKNSRGCGLATTLMEFCFTDDNVGKVDVNKNEIFKLNVKWRYMAIKNCEHIVFLQCIQLDNNFEPKSCSGYLTAAINTNHAMMFVQDQLNTRLMFVMNVESIQLEFKDNPQGWLNKYGMNWFFCQCKEERMTECMTMS